MALNADLLAGEVFGAFVGAFPDVVDVVRENRVTGVTPHNPTEKLVHGLAAGLVDGVRRLKWEGLLDGDDDPEGTAEGQLFTLPGSEAAAAHFIELAEWDGPDSRSVAEILIWLMLDTLAATSTFRPESNRLVGTGTATFDPGTYNLDNDFQETAAEILNQTLAAALKDEGVFGQDDVPGAPVNQTLAEQIPNYASAYALGLATLSATVEYVGEGGGSPTATTPAYGSLA